MTDQNSQFFIRFNLPTKRRRFFQDEKCRKILSATNKKITPKTKFCEKKIFWEKAVEPTKIGVQISEASKKYNVNFAKPTRKNPAAKYVGSRKPTIKRLEKTACPPRFSSQTEALSIASAETNREKIRVFKMEFPKILPVQ